MMVMVLMMMMKEQKIVVDAVFHDESKSRPPRRPRDSPRSRDCLSSVMADYRRVVELERRILELDSKCAALRAEKPDDDYLQNAASVLEKLKSSYTHAGESSSLHKLLQDYTQVILDITFYEENKLVDQEFPEEISPFKIQQLLQDLTEPELLAARLAPSQEVQAVLGLELLECVYWRRGALLYMYCHTLHQRKQWIKKNKATFLKCVQEGVRYLMKMLQVRSSVKLSDGVVFHDSNTTNLLTEGTLSDTHLLTMMYIGELCFWAVKYEEGGVDSSQCRDDTLHFRDIGTHILLKYVRVCEGPLQGQGWNTENAKEILNILQ